MVSEVYDALVAAGAPESKAREDAEAIPATKQDIGDIESNISELRSLLEDWRSVVVTHAELHRSQCELEADLSAERWKFTVVQIVATVILVVALLRFL